MNNRLAGPYKCKQVQGIAWYLSLSQSERPAFPRHTRSACVNLIPKAVNVLHNGTYDI